MSIWTDEQIQRAREHREKEKAWRRGYWTGFLYTALCSIVAIEFVNCVVRNG